MKTIAELEQLTSRELIVLYVTASTEEEVQLYTHVLAERNFYTNEKE